MISKPTMPLSILKDRHLGERLVIVANGPSLNRMDLSFLKYEITLGMNKIYLGFKTFKFYPRYYVAVNDKVLKQSEKHIKALTSVKFLSDRVPLFSQDPLTYLLKTLHQGGFRHDIRQGIREGGTVTYTALQIAYFLGFSEVILIGLDHRYDYQGQPNETKVMHGPDANHFDPHYFGYGQTWDNPDLSKAEASYQLAKEEYEKANRKILDATLGGACTVFDKVDYREVFKLGDSRA